MPKTLCIDFDGCVHSYTSGWQGANVVTDPPVKGAMAWLVDCVNHFDEVCIYSSRSKEAGGIEAMKFAIEVWLQDDLNYSRHDAQQFVDERLSFPMHKPAAFLTIDDRAICFNGPPFPSMQEMLDFEPWTKRKSDAGMMPVSEALRTDPEAAP